MILEVFMVSLLVSADVEGEMVSTVEETIVANTTDTAEVALAEEAASGLGVLELSMLGWVLDVLVCLLEIYFAINIWNLGQVYILVDKTRDVDDYKAIWLI